MEFFCFHLLTIKILVPAAIIATAVRGMVIANIVFHFPSSFIIVRSVVAAFVVIKLEIVEVFVDPVVTVTVLILVDEDRLDDIVVSFDAVDEVFVEVLIIDDED